MRTSGAGGRDVWMTAVPLGMLVLFVMWMAGGPRESFKWLEVVIGSSLTWLASWVR